MKLKTKLAASALALAASIGMAEQAAAAEKFRVGIVTFLSGQAAESFGVPAWNGGKTLIDMLNEGGKMAAPYDQVGFGGLEIEVVLVDEAGGATKQVQEFRNLVQRENVDAVVASNDGTAGGAVAALTAQGMDGIPVSGQDGDHAALNRVAMGSQTVSVWKDSRDLGTAAAEIAVAMAGGAAMADIEGAQEWTSPAGTTMTAMFLAPVPITADNLSVVTDAGWITVETLCQGVSGGPAPCN
jgi:ABC-type sugar transport system substrate-binding protein